MKDKKHHSRPLLLGIVFVILSNCTPHQFIRLNPPPATGEMVDTIQSPRSDSVREATSDIDFADAFDTTKTIISGEDSLPTFPQPVMSNIPVAAMHFPLFKVPTTMVRIALEKDCDRIVIYSVGNAMLSSPKVKKNLPVRGRILFKITGGTNKVVITSRNLNTEMTLPCTLRSESDYNFLDIGDASYRGSIILIPGKSHGFTLVNRLEMEDYLRGVVPLELGRRSREEIEALKAQSVAARTYAYRRILECSKQPFDMVNTIADQVYGGATVEYRESDAAIKATHDLLLVYRDDIISSYYHSTCGGTTAAISDVWNQSSQPYLCGVADVDSTGKAYCAQSPYYSWEESWHWKQFSSIVQTHLEKLFPQTKLSGSLKSFTIDDRFNCGRIKKVRFIGIGWEQDVGGDQLRFILRRGVSGYPILRSSNFYIERQDKSIIRLSGKGNGHGIGMCQMGAVGRALAGQHFVGILTSYYPGVSIVTAHCVRCKN